MGPQIKCDAPNCYATYPGTGKPPNWFSIDGPDALAARGHLFYACSAAHAVAVVEEINSEGFFIYLESKDNARAESDEDEAQ